MLPLMLMLLRMIFPLFFIFRSPTQARRREAAGTPQKRHLRAAIFYSFGARVRGQPAGRYAISRADRTHSHGERPAVFFIEQAAPFIFSLLTRRFDGKLLFPVLIKQSKRRIITRLRIKKTTQPLDFSAFSFIVCNLQRVFSLRSVGCVLINSTLTGEVMEKLMSASLV